MKDISPQAESTTSIVRLSFQSAHKDKVEASEEWFAATDRLKQEPDLGFVTIGCSTADEADIVLFISWDYAAKPSASFQSGDVDDIFSPLSAFLAEKPRLICNICNIEGVLAESSFTTHSSWPEFMSEMITVRGPATATESTMSKISKDADGYMYAMDIGIDFHGIHHSKQTLRGCSSVYRLSGEYARDGIDGEEHIDHASFILLFFWHSPSRRAEIQDPDIPDCSIPAFLQKSYGSNWWQKKVMEPLEEVGATTSSFLYHKGHIAHDRKGVLIMSKFKFWLQYGYMDDDSLAQFERQLAEKNQQQEQQQQQQQ